IPSTIHVLGEGSTNGLLDIENGVTVTCEGGSRIRVLGGGINYDDSTVDDCGLPELIVVDGTNVDINALLDDEDLEGQHLRLLPGATAFVDEDLMLGKVLLGGAEIVPSTIEVLGVGTSVGVLTIETGATLLCDAGSTMVADGGTIVINGVAQLNCDGASLRSSNKGQVSLAQNLTVSSGAFIGGNGVFS